MKIKYVLIFLFTLYISKLCVFSQETIKRIDYAYETEDSLIFYGNTSDSLRCMLSTELLFLHKSYKNVSLKKIQIDRMDIRRVSDNKRIEFISNYIYKKKPWFFNAIYKYMFDFLKKQEVEIFELSKETLKGNDCFLKTGFFIWIYIYPYPKNWKDLKNH